MRAGRWAERSRSSSPCRADSRSTSSTSSRTLQGQSYRHSRSTSSVLSSGQRPRRPRRALVARTDGGTASGSRPPAGAAAAAAPSRRPAAGTATAMQPAVGHGGGQRLLAADHQRDVVVGVLGQRGRQARPAATRLSAVRLARYSVPAAGLGQRPREPTASRQSGCRSRSRRSSPARAPVRVAEPGGQALAGAGLALDDHRAAAARPSISSGCSAARSTGPTCMPRPSACGQRGLGGAHRRLACRPRRENPPGG